MSFFARVRPAALMGLILLGAVARADDPAFDKAIADIRLLQIKAVQTEVGLSEAQRNKLNSHAKWLNDQQKALQKQYGDKLDPKSAKAKEAEGKLGKILHQFAQDCIGELSATQIKRLRELTIQQAGKAAIFDLRVANKVGLSKAQVDTLRAKFRDVSERAGKLQQNAVAPIAKKYQGKPAKDKAEAEARQKEVNAALKPIQPKLKALQEEFLATWNKTVTAKQQATLTALMGKPFKG